ncbi:MAG: carboxynorspermidine decarboxylase [Lachnospiraceae bacterium]|uniref:carboxynorspermidine decarboxylase n=1 Tax=Roseburia hominis TaxID=301301 RepID=UPI001F272AA7|nr:carboxynorspermidine decarboxylase [Roseburia hominis]MDY4839675.1 carboxynorspermidine decarboxylase [Lachnospiraceae bacterium]
MQELKTPCYIIDEKKLKENLTILRDLEQKSGCHVLLAQKAFSMYRLYPLMGEYLSGTTASGLYEARLGKEEMGKENHVFAPAYKKDDMKELVEICDHIIFNSFSQYETHRDMIQAHNTALNEKQKKVSIGIRVNPECSTQGEHAIYDPCASGSRLGVTKANFPDTLPADIEGLHFHTLCEQDSDDLIKTFHVFEEKFGSYLKSEQIKWLNLGGGHHITRKGYHLKELEDLISYIKETYQVEVYLEPGEAVALNAGYLLTEVMDIVKNDLDILILDASAACHMPDVLEMPYRPPLKDAYPAGEKKYTYRLSSLTCLAGDVIGDYSFEKEIHIGDRLLFEDMAIYSMVKNNTFNGIPLPAIVLRKEDGTTETIKEFSYEDFKGRLS